MGAARRLPAWRGGPVILRPYQKRLVEGAVKLWSGSFRRIAMVMATGGGKTATGSEIVTMCLGAGRPVLWLAHRAELIDQASDSLRQALPEAAGLGIMDGARKQYRADVVVGSVPTCATPGSLALLKSRSWGLIVVDETHHVAAATYQRILKELGAWSPDGPLTLGVTATLQRGDGLALGDTFEAVIDPKIGLMDLLKDPDGPFLVRPRGIRVRISGLDLGSVRRVAGDYSKGALGAAMTDAMAPQKIVEAWLEHAKGRPTIAFLPTVAVSRDQADAFKAAGFRAEHIDDKTPKQRRRDLIAAFRRGEVDVLCNVGLFTEGTDLPSVSCVILGRPTSSGTLYQQMVGRGLRLHPGKSDCIILDVTGVTGRHRLATLASLDGAASPEDTPDDLLLYEDDYDEGDSGPADDAEDDDQGVTRPEYAEGDLEHELFDLFGSSHSSWLRTDGGVWFLPTPQAFIYLAPTAPERYDVRWCRAEGPREDGLIRADMTIEYAMATGDEYVAERPIWQLERDAPWRRTRLRNGQTRGEVADAKARARASAALDGPAR